MATIILQPDITDNQHSINWFITKTRFSYKESIASGATGDSVMIPPGQGEVNITLAPTGTAKLQYSQDTMQAIKDGSADWFDWPDGEVSSVTNKVMSNTVSAVRGVSITGTVTLHISI